MTSTKIGPCLLEDVQRHPSAACSFPLHHSRTVARSEPVERGCAGISPRYVATDAERRGSDFCESASRCSRRVPVDGRVRRRGMELHPTTHRGLGRRAHGVVEPGDERRDRVLQPPRYASTSCVSTPAASLLAARYPHDSLDSRSAIEALFTEGRVVWQPDIG